LAQAEQLATLQEIVDLGKRWSGRTGDLPLPLGGNAVRRDLGTSAVRTPFAAPLRQLAYRLTHRREAVEHAMQFGGRIDKTRTDRFGGCRWTTRRSTTANAGRGGSPCPRIHGSLADAHAAGAQYRRLRGKLGTPKAITAMDHKLARLVHRLLKWGHEYVDQGLKNYEARHREQQVQLLKKRAARLGLQIVEPEIA